jgi:hypothetical protein
MEGKSAEELPHELGLIKVRTALFRIRMRPS